MIFHLCNKIFILFSHLSHWIIFYRENQNHNAYYVWLTLWTRVKVTYQHIFILILDNIFSLKLTYCWKMRKKFFLHKPFCHMHFWYLLGITTFIFNFKGILFIPLAPPPLSLSRWFIAQVICGSIWILFWNLWVFLVWWVCTNLDQPQSLLIIVSQSCRLKPLTSRDIGRWNVSPVLECLKRNSSLIKKTNWVFLLSWLNFFCCWDMSFSMYLVSSLWNIVMYLWHNITYDPLILHLFNKYINSSSTLWYTTFIFLA